MFCFSISEYTNAAEQVLRNSMVIVARVPKQAPANGLRNGAGGSAYSYMAPKQKILYVSLCTQLVFFTNFTHFNLYINITSFFHSNPEQLEITDVYKAVRYR